MQGKRLIISGPAGSGKTTMLMNLVSQYKHAHQLRRFHGNRFVFPETLGDPDKDASDTLYFYDGASLSDFKYILVDFQDCKADFAIITQDDITELVHNSICTQQDFTDVPEDKPEEFPLLAQTLFTFSGTIDVLSDSNDNRINLLHEISQSSISNIQEIRKLQNKIDGLRNHQYMLVTTFKHYCNALDHNPDEAIFYSKDGLIYKVYHQNSENIESFRMKDFSHPQS